MISEARVRHTHTHTLSMCFVTHVVVSGCVCVCVLQQSLVTKVSRRQRVDMNLLFLNIKVRRAQLLSDSLDEVCACISHTKTRSRLTHGNGGVALVACVYLNEAKLTASL